MGRRIIKQPNGLYAIWSSFVDNFIVFSATKEDLHALFMEEAEAEISSMIEKAVQKKRSMLGYDFNDYLLKIRDIHGDEEMRKAQELMSEKVHCIPTSDYYKMLIDRHNTPTEVAKELALHYYSLGYYDCLDKRGFQPFNRKHT